jgi:hypothetical protein
VDHLKGGIGVWYIWVVHIDHRSIISTTGKVGEHESIHSNLAQLIGQSMTIIFYTFRKFSFSTEDGMLSL